MLKRKFFYWLTISNFLYIIILLILAGVSIATLMGDNGLLTKANEAKEANDKEEVRERLTLVLSDIYIEKKTNAEYNESDLDSYIYEREPEADVNGEEISLNGHTFELDRSVPKLGEWIGETGNLPAKIRKIDYTVDAKAKAISVEVIAVRTEQVENPMYKYYIKEDGQEDSAYVEKATQTENTYIFDRLEEKNYIIKVELVSQGTTDIIAYNVTDTIEVNVLRPTTVEEAKETGVTYAKTTPIKDILDNVVYIPGKFKVASDSGISVEEGIVIEDISGNQFVWIPVGEYRVSEALSKIGILTNNLKRRQWGTSVNVPIAPVEVEGDASVEGHNGYYQGESISIESFLTKTKTKGGFYIGRYEQGTGNVIKKNVAPYTNIIRDTAKAKAEAIDGESEFITSELISSYAWDSALNFICQTNEDGNKLSTVNSPLYGNMGVGTTINNTGCTPKDNYNNIFDLLGNVLEWTTEISSIPSNPYVGRGGFAMYGYGFPAYREYYTNTYKNDPIGFRTQLYIN